MGRLDGVPYIRVSGIGEKSTISWRFWLGSDKLLGTLLATLVLASVSSSRERERDTNTQIDRGIFLLDKFTSLGDKICQNALRELDFLLPHFIFTLSSSGQGSDGSYWLIINKASSFVCEGREAVVRLSEKAAGTCNSSKELLKARSDIMSCGLHATLSDVLKRGTVPPPDWRKGLQQPLYHYTACCIRQYIHSSTVSPSV